MTTDSDEMQVFLNNADFIAAELENAMWEAVKTMQPELREEVEETIAEGVKQFEESAAGVTALQGITVAAMFLRLMIKRWDIEGPLGDLGDRP